MDFTSTHFYNYSNYISFSKCFSYFSTKTCAFYWHVNDADISVARADIIVVRIKEVPVGDVGVFQPGRRPVYSISKTNKALIAF